MPSVVYILKFLFLFFIWDLSLNLIQILLMNTSMMQINQNGKVFKFYFIFPPQARFDASELITQREMVYQDCSEYLSIQL